MSSESLLVVYYSCNIWPEPQIEVKTNHCNSNDSKKISCMQFLCSPKYTPTITPNDPGMIFSYNSACFLKQFAFFHSLLFSPIAVCEKNVICMHENKPPFFPSSASPLSCLPSTSLLPPCILLIALFLTLFYPTYIPSPSSHHSQTSAPSPFFLPPKTTHAVTSFWGKANFIFSGCKTHATMIETCKADLMILLSNGIASNEHDLPPNGEYKCTVQATTL